MFMLMLFQSVGLTKTKFLHISKKQNFFHFQGILNFTLVFGHEHETVLKFWLILGI